MSRGLSLRIILALFLCRAALGMLIVPPWQGPDEPSHYVLAELAARGRVADSPARLQLEHQVLVSMAAHQWWRGYRQGAPRPLPASFAGVSEHLATGTDIQPTYYWMASGILHVFPSGNLEARYLVLRVCSLVLGALTIAFVWLGARRLVDEQSAAMATLAVALSPQFLLSALTVSPEPLVNALGGLMWWQAAAFLTAGAPLSAAIALVSAAVAAITKRNAVPLLAALAVLLVWGWSRRMRHRPLVLVAGLAAGAAAVAAVVYSRLEFVPGFDRLLLFWSYALVAREPVAGITVTRVAEFVTGLVDSSWLVAGWLRFPAPFPWLIAARVLTLLGAVGSLVAFVRMRQFRVAIGAAAVIAVIQIGATTVNGVLAHGAPLGRYLFVAIAPLALLLWLGFRQWWPRAAWPFAAPALAVILVLLDITGWITTLLPAYA